MFKLLMLFTIFLSPQFLFSQKDIKIGTQVWMSKSLDVDTFRNGDRIRQARDAKQLQYAKSNNTPAWCYYQFDEDNGKRYGKLYNWAAVNDQRGIAPIGYHIPSDVEWSILSDFLGGEKIAGKKMKSRDAWVVRDCLSCDDSDCRKFTNTPFSGGGDNSSGLDLLPGGELRDAEFKSIGCLGVWWTASMLENRGSARCRMLSNGDGSILTKEVHEVDLGFGYYFFSVRCLKD
jgi:uncharacterized protein (TIGR02145 family)